MTIVSSAMVPSPIILTPRLRGGVIPIVRFALFAAMLGLISWYALAIWHLDKQPRKRFALASVSFDIEAGETIEIGRRDLGQAPGTRSAERDHISFFHDPATKELTLRKIAESKRLDLRFAHGGRTVYSDRYPIPLAKDGIAQVVIGSRTIDLQRIDTDRINISVDGPTGRQITEVTGLSQVKMSGGAGFEWCETSPSNFDSLSRKPIWKLKQASRTASESWLIPDKLREPSARRIAHIGGPVSCRLATGAALVALPNADPEMEFGIRRFFNDGDILYFLHPIKLPENTPVSYQTRTSTGDLENVQTNFQSLEWPVTSDTPDDKSLVNGFTAGFTRYGLKIDNRANEEDPWRVTIFSRSRSAYFDERDCSANFTSIWPDDKYTEQQKRAILQCPGPSRLENADNTSFSFESASLSSPIDRLFSYGRTRFVSETPTSQSSLSPTELSLGEKGAHGLFSFVALVILFLAMANGAGRRAPMRWLRTSLIIVTSGCILLPLGVVWLNAWPATQIANIMFAANVLTLVMVAIVGLIDSEGTWLTQLLTLVLFSLLLIGAITLFSLSAEADTAKWERYFIKHKAFVLDLLPAFWIAICLHSAITPRTWLGRRLVEDNKWYSPFTLVPIGMLLIFVLWLLLGTQQGLLGFQPVEFGKFIVLVGLGAVLARWALKARLLKTIPIRGKVLGIAIVCFMVALVVVPVLKSDVSPIIIVGASFAGTAALELVATVLRIITERRNDRQALFALPTRSLPKGGEKTSFLSTWTPLTALIVAFALLFGAYTSYHRGVAPEGFELTACPASQIDAAQKALGEGRRTITERFFSWADMRYQRGLLDAKCLSAKNQTYDGKVRLTDRELTLQGLRSRAAIANATCGLSDTFYSGPLRWLGEAFPGIQNPIGRLEQCTAGNREQPTPECNTQDLKAPVEPHCIPVVESDFIGAFLLAHHGLGAGLILLLTQVCFVAVCLYIYVRLKTAPVREPIVRGAQDALATMTLGATLLFVMQWVLSWGNTFVLLPIMGQPMTWISAATSHHLLMAIPAACALLISARIARARISTIPFGQHP